MLIKFNPLILQQKFRLEIWPGFETAIRMHEESLLMVIDNINKVLRLDTVLDQLKKIFNNDPQNYQDNCLRELVGSVVMVSECFLYF